MLVKKVCIVTGANGGIGKEIVRGLARNGATVVLACRDAIKGAAAVREIETDTGNQNLEVLPVDLSSQYSIHSFVQQFEAKHSHLHVLINNAVTAPASKHRSVDGIELSFATNVMAYFLLPNLLRDTLRRGSPSRIINISARFAGDLDLNDLQFDQRQYDRTKAYRQSKQANRMLSWAFHQKFHKDGITVNCCHPGIINTQLLKDLGFSGGEKPSKGAETPLFLATDPQFDTNSGGWWVDLKQERCAFTKQQDQIDQLWTKCESLAKIPLKHSGNRL